VRGISVITLLKFVENNFCYDDATAFVANALAEHIERLLGELDALGGLILANVYQHFPEEAERHGDCVKHPTLRGEHLELKAQEVLIYLSLFYIYIRRIVTHKNFPIAG